MIMSMPQGLADLIRLHEGRRNKIYKDSLGKWTGGIGHLLSPKQVKRYRGGTIPDRTIIDWFHADCNRAWSEAGLILHQRGIPHSTRIQKALAMMCFQLGFEGTCRFNNMLAAIKRGSYPQAAIEMERSRWYKQTPKRVAAAQAVLLGG